MWWYTVTHGRGSEGGNWRTEWVASTLHTTSEHGVSSITTADAYTSAASSRLNWRPSADLNGLVRFAERRNLIPARVPSHFKRSLRSQKQSIGGYRFEECGDVVTVVTQWLISQVTDRYQQGRVKVHIYTINASVVEEIMCKNYGIAEQLNLNISCYRWREGTQNLCIASWYSG